MGSMPAPKSGGEEHLAATRLVHPIYLDVPMLVSFLASVEGGVSFEDQSTHRRGASTRRDREGAGAAGGRLPVLPSILSLDISGRLRSQASQDESQEVVAVRRHTEASLFNVLRYRLEAEGAVKTIRAPKELATVALGDLVQVSGEVVGNPLQQTLALLIQLANLAGIDLQALLAEPEKQAKKTQRSPQGKSPHAAQRGQQGKSPHALQLPQGAPDADPTSGLRQFVAVVVEILNAPV